MRGNTNKMEIFWMRLLWEWRKLLTLNKICETTGRTRIHSPQLQRQISVRGSPPSDGGGGGTFSCAGDQRRRHPSPSSDRWLEVGEKQRRGGADDRRRDLGEERRELWEERWELGAGKMEELGELGGRKAAEAAGKPRRWWAAQVIWVDFAWRQWNPQNEFLCNKQVSNRVFCCFLCLSINNLLVSLYRNKLTFSHPHYLNADVFTL